MLKKVPENIQIMIFGVFYLERIATRFLNAAKGVVSNADMLVGKIKQFCQLQDEGQSSVGGGFAIPPEDHDEVIAFLIQTGTT